MPSLDAIRADPHPEDRPGVFGGLKNDVIAAVGEFIGTVAFLLFALGATQTVVRPAGELSEATEGDAAYQVMTLFYISAAFGFSLFAAASIFFRFTGSIFNPSVGLALWLSGVIGPVRLVPFAQMLGGIVAAGIVRGLTPGDLGVNCRLSDGVSSARGLFVEMFGTMFLTLSVLMLAAEKHNMTPMAPLGIGMTLFVVELWSVPLTGGAVNTARAFGPDVAAASFASYHWIYWLGPTLGALLATALYYLLKTIGYWRINPGQDTVDVRESALNDLHLSRSNDVGQTRSRSPITRQLERMASPRSGGITSGSVDGSGTGAAASSGRTRGDSLGARMSGGTEMTYSSRNPAGWPRSPIVQDNEKLGRPLRSAV